MPRIPYIVDGSAGPPDLVAEIRARRGGDLLNLDRILLNSPALARGWNAHLGAVRGELGVSPKLRELAICAVAVLNGADYEFEQHLQPFLEAGGSRAAVNELQRLKSSVPRANIFSAVELATLQLTQEMTQNVTVSDSTFDRLREELRSDQHVVELVAVVATYNMVSRFLVALQVETLGEGVANSIATETPSSE
jgi:alkylhydroperoxidase family enzyme